MATKTIALYPQTTEPFTNNGKNLRLEIGALHVACSVTKDNQPIAFEYFELNNDLNDWSDIFFEVKNNSKLLDNGYQTVDIHCNFKESILAPVEKLNSAAAEDYLSLVYGESAKQDIKQDKLIGDTSMVNVYRVRKTILEQAARHFHLYQIHHSYTNILNQLFRRDDTGSSFLKLQFYNQSFIAVLLVEGKLQLIQTFAHSNTEEACYHLLNLIKQYSIDPALITLELSGFLTPHDELHRRIQQLFPKRLFSNLPETLVLPGMMEEYHAHYFTPFFNTEA